jgi:hypothetical protein
MKVLDISVGRLPAAVMAAVTLMAGALLLPEPAAARGYQGAQAEAQLDGQQDPYSFPNIRLCCQEKPKHRPHRPDWGPAPIGAGRNVVVNCAAPTSRGSFGTVREALEFMRGAPGQVSVVPGAPCDVSGLSFGGGVVVTSANYAYGPRARLVGATCAQVVAGGTKGPAVFGGIDMDVCVNVRSGEVNFEEVNLAWRGQDSAILVTSGGVTMRRSTIRAKDAALFAVSAGRVWINESRLATTQNGPFVVRMNAANINLSGVLVKGAKAGIVIDGARDALQLTGVNVVRWEAEDPYPASSPGDFGILVGGGQALNDLPWLSGLEARRIVIKGVTVSGYNTGLSLGAGASVLVEDTVVNGPAHGIKVAPGAYVTLRNNKVNGSRVVAIDLQAGARGEADRNSLTCQSGDCVCYGGDCTSRANRIFGQGAFRMRDTDCDR